MESFGFEKNVKQLIMRFSSCIENIDKAVMHTSEFVTSQRMIIDAYGLKLVLSEGITNAVVHGNREDEKQDVMIKITITHEKITIRIKDMGTGFDWRKRIQQAEADPEDIRGRGLHLIKAYGYEISFNNDGNIMYLHKKLESAESGAAS
jgi:serine/threonine-protein kinase RsbW